MNDVWLKTHLQPAHWVSRQAPRISLGAEEAIVTIFSQIQQFNR